MEIHPQSLLTSISRFILDTTVSLSSPPTTTCLGAFGHGWQHRDGGAAHSPEDFKQIMEPGVKPGRGPGSAESNKH